MNFSEYQDISAETAIYPTIGHPIIYPALGLANEAGEVLGKIKKVFRDNNEEFDIDNIKTIRAELGDVLWYLSQVATELDLSLNEIASLNIDKLLDRQSRGVLKGNGDNR